MTPRTSITFAGRAACARSILTGVQYNVPVMLALGHARFQARVGLQGHDGFSDRLKTLKEYFPDLNFLEVANESWPGQSQKDAAIEMWESWRISKGHWDIVNRECVCYGYDMALGDNGIWYACGIVGFQNGA